MADNILIRRLEADDAPALVDCFRRCYGDTYPNELFYDAAALRGKISANQLCSVIAVPEGQGETVGDIVGDIVGHTGLTVRHVGATAAEAGNTVVDPTMRGQGLLGQLGLALRELSVRKGFAGYVHYPTTAHDIMQKAAVSGTGRETGIMLNYIPAETEYLDIDQPQGRLAVTIVYQPLAQTATTAVYAPDRYAELLSRLAGSLNLKRKWLSCAESVPQGQSAQFEIVQFAKRGLAAIQIDVFGMEILDKISALPDLPVIQVDLSMHDPAIGVAVSALNEHGFRYSGWLPGFQESDTLRLQKLDFTAVHKPKLVTGCAEDLYQLIMKDY